jgi:hypothetical protein
LGGFSVIVSIFMKTLEQIDTVGRDDAIAMSRVNGLIAGSQSTLPEREKELR